MPVYSAGFYCEKTTGLVVFSFREIFYVNFAYYYLFLMQKVKKEGKTSILSGHFAGYKDCKIYVFSYSDDLEVWRTGLEIPSTAFETQTEFISVYVALNANLIEKYGAPVNGAFHTENGRIELYTASRNDKGKTTACIRLSYTDTENEQKKDAAFKSDL